jgi:[citrate (pro-3S)-lyase] ligase
VALDLAVFRRIAAALDISLRYVGEEPFSRVTRVYNEVMAEALPESGIVCRIIPRYKANGRVISASTVREAIRDGRLEDVRAMLPESTYRYFTSEESEPVIRAIRAEKDVRHY